MAVITPEQIDVLNHVFSYHAPTEEQKHQYEVIRTAAKAFAAVIIENTPRCPDQTVALRKLRESVMIANAAVALEGRSL
jgi:citrate lyase beta subunit